MKAGQENAKYRPADGGEYVLFGVPRIGCTGCCACMNACPNGCITMTQDREGFRYPSIDIDKCIYCGMCSAACPADKDIERRDKTTAWACYIKDEGERLSSSSGGIFPLLAGYVLERGGYVYGAEFDADFGVVHGCANNYEQARRFKGSKYVQSYIGKTYKDIKKKLEYGNPVLFSGTPCQCAGLKSYLGSDWEELICVDFICHGVPSPAVWRDYVGLLSQGDKPQSVSFRDKSTGWSNYSLTVDSPNGSASERSDRSRYIRGFIMDLYLRPSCYSCRYKGAERCSDITLADFWGAQFVVPHLDDNKGLSLVTVRSRKGEEILDNIKGDIISSEVHLDTVLGYNKSALQSATLTDTRRRFFEDYGKIPFDRLMDKYCKVKILDILRHYFFLSAARLRCFLIHR